MAVSLNIANASNSLPWTKIKSALNRNRVPAYLKKMIEGYLKHKKIVYSVGKSLPLE